MDCETHQEQKNEVNEKVLENELYMLYGSVNAIYHMVHANHNKVEAIHFANLLHLIKKKLWKIAETVSHD